MTAVTSTYEQILVKSGGSSTCGTENYMKYILKGNQSHIVVNRIKLDVANRSEFFFGKNYQFHDFYIDFEQFAMGCYWDKNGAIKARVKTIVALCKSLVGIVRRQLHVSQDVGHTAVRENIILSTCLLHQIIRKIYQGEMPIDFCTRCYTGAHYVFDSDKQKFNLVCTQGCSTVTAVKLPLTATRLKMESIVSDLVTQNSLDKCIMVGYKSLTNKGTFQDQVDIVTFQDPVAENDMAPRRLRCQVFVLAFG